MDLLKAPRGPGGTHGHRTEYDFFLPKGHLPRAQALAVVKKLADAGFQKITFAGGESTLYPWLGDLILRAKERGLTTPLRTPYSPTTFD